MAQREAVFEQRFEIRRRGAVVFRHRLAEEVRGARPLAVVVVYGEVPDLAVFPVYPILRTLGGENGRLNGKDELPSGPQPAAHLFDDGRVIGDVVQGKRAEHEVEAVFGEFERFDRAVPVFDAGGKPRVAGDFPARDLEHARREIDAEHRFRAVFNSPNAVPAVTAAEVQNAPALDRRQNAFERLPLARAGQPLARAGHLAVFLKKRRIVVNIFLQFDRLLLSFVPIIAEPGAKAKRFYKIMRRRAAGLADWAEMCDTV